MADITISTVITEDRRLVIDVPNDIPIGRVNITISPVEADAPSTDQPLTRETARAKLMAAGFLVTEFDIPKDFTPLSDEELLKLMQLPEGARPSEELIDEDRGEY